MPVLRRDLHRLGYASVPIRLRASDVGAPFKGSRIFIVAASNSQGQSASALNEKMARLPQIAEACWQDWGQPPATALGVADGIPDRMERLRMTGNAVVPAMAHVVGRLIQELTGGA